MIESDVQCAEDYLPATGDNTDTLSLASLASASAALTGFSLVKRRKYRR